MFGQWYSFQYLKGRNFHGPQNDVIRLSLRLPSFPLHSLPIQRHRTDRRFFFFFFSFFFSLSLADVRAHVYQSNEATTRSVARPRPNGNAFHGFSGRDASILAPWLEICRPTVIPYTPWPDQRSITNPTPTDSPHFLSDRRSSPSRG